MPRDRSLYGLVQNGNIDLKHRPRIRNADGSTSTVRSITVTGDKGRGIVLPTAIGGKIRSNEDSIRHFQETGEHLGVFDNETDATRFAEKLHEAEARKLERSGPMRRPTKDPDRSGAVQRRLGRREAAFNPPRQGASDIRSKTPVTRGRSSNPVKGLEGKLKRAAIRRLNG